ncbi:ArsR/SmtB family transcription factor [Actinocatenispora comari]|uniref:ArsR/SmtB family transcription factor n=1 Tax=Actinocatenispora comari TaxID=2807577 RepID=UPI001CED4826|nr:helix-turn-helix domain-containing protein [Actinocatenispora comari]
MARLLGPGRARVLAEVRTPATSSQLAVALDLSLGTVSAHLATLRQAGVVTRQRTGRSVYYERTPLGDELVGLITGAVGSPVRR